MIGVNSVEFYYDGDMMKSKIFYLLTILLVFSLPSYSNEKDELIIDCGYYWHNDSLVIAPDAKPLQYFVDSVKLFSGRNFFSINRENEIVIDTIGYIADRKIIDIVFRGRLGDTFYDVGKMTLIENTSSEYQLLYNYFTDPGCINYEKSIIRRSDTIDILYTKSRFTGNESWYTQSYWAYNKLEYCFFTFDYNISKELFNQLMPDSCTLRYLTFDIDELYLHSYLKKPNDHMNWPTCGGISVWYAFEGCNFIILRSEFNPNDTTTH